MAVDEWLSLVLSVTRQPWIYLVSAGAILSFVVTARKKILHDFEILEKLEKSDLGRDGIFRARIERSLVLSLKLTYGWIVFLPIVFAVMSGCVMLLISVLLGELAATSNWALFWWMAIVYPIYAAFFYAGLAAIASPDYKNLSQFLEWQQPVPEPSSDLQ